MGAIRYNAQPGTAAAALFTAETEVVIGGLFAVNATKEDQTLTLSVRRAHGGVEPLLTAEVIEAGTARHVVNMTWMAHQGVLLRPGDSLNGSASAAKAITLLAHE